MTSSTMPAPNGRNKQEHPHYFGTYLNMARHNAFMIIRQLSEKYKEDIKEYNPDTKKMLYDTIPTEEDFHNAPILNWLKKSSKKPDIVQSLVRDLRQLFPFLNYQEVLNGKAKQQTEGTVTEEQVTDLFEILRGMKEKPKEVSKTQDAPYLQPKEIAELLLNMLDWMRRLRNNYSHFGYKPKLDFKQKEVLDKIYEAALFKLIDRDKRTKRYDVFEATHIEHILSNDTNKKAERVPYLISPTIVDEKTLAFFTCLFLEPKYASIFLSRLDDFRQELTLEEMPLEMRAMWRCYMMFCCRLPQPKLESSDVMLDMLNELSRCPNDLYKVFSETDKALFNKTPKSDDENEANTTNTTEGEDTAVGIAPQTLMKRYDDRFPYFVLRYFDDTNAFDHLRFHVHLGKYLKKDPYPKTIMSEVRQRDLIEPIRTFTKLKPFRDRYDAVNQDDLDFKIIDPQFTNEFKRRKWAVDDAGVVRMRDEIEQFSPRYNFGEQTVAFKFVKTPNDNEIPELAFTEKKDATGNTQRSLKKEVDDENPVCIISTYELRNMFFYHLLHKEGKIKDSVEIYLAHYLVNIRRFFEDVKSGELQPLITPPDFKKNENKPFHKDRTKAKELLKAYDARQNKMVERREILRGLLKERYDLGLHAIPTVIKEYLLAYERASYRDVAIQKIDKQMKDVKERLKMIEKSQAPKRGGMATYIAEDIVFMMPTREHFVNGIRHEQKMNNDQFRVLQSSIAFFLINKDNIKSFFEETGLNRKGSTEQHPFLFRIPLHECTGVLHFYSKYLEAKLKYLENAQFFLTPFRVEKIKNKFGKLKDKNILTTPPKDAEIKAKYGSILIIDERQAIERNYSNVPALLPKGLFNEPIAEAMNVMSKEGFKGVNNVVYNLEEYLKGDTQPFYIPDTEAQRFIHHYRGPRQDKDTEGAIFEKSDLMTGIENEILRLETEKRAHRPETQEEKQYYKDNLRDAHRLKDRILENEQTIRYHQTNDRALWLMVKGLSAFRSKIVDNEEAKIDFDAQDLSLKGINITDTPIILASTGKKVRNILDEPVDMSLKVGKVTIKDTLEIKRHGDFRRILKDRRIPNLVSYMTETEVHYEIIKKELERYDLRRDKFFAIVYKFEETVFNKFNAELPPSSDYYSHRDFMSVAINHLTDPAERTFYNEYVVQLRNKFMHNEMPYFDWLDNEVKQAQKEYIVDNVFDIAEGYYKKLIKHLKAL